MNFKYINILWISLLSILSLDSVAENNSNLHLQLDKNCYVSGETIRFKNSISAEEKDKNNILFIDLCSDGNLLSSAVIKRSNCHWEGELVIPDSLQTGIYLFRAYTGNELGKPNVVCQLVPVLNRFGNNVSNEEKKKSSRNQPFYCSNDNQLAYEENLKTYANKNTFEPNETAKFSIEKLANNFIGGISFKVVKIDTSTYAQTNKNKEFIAYLPSNKIKIYNELNLRGKVINKLTNLPVSEEIVLFSIPDSVPQINYSTTNETGEFQFNINNCNGIQTAIVQTLNKKLELNLELYPVFLLPPPEIPYYLPLETEESEFAQLAVKRAAFTNAYLINDTNYINTEYKFKYPFYGITDQIVYPSNFIDLNDFEEIAKEILPLVSYKHSGGEYTMKIYNPDSKNFYYNPWVLIDGIPVSDLSVLNKLNSLAIKSVKTQTTFRCYGNLMLEGVVSVFTKIGNFETISLPKNAVKTTIDTFFKPVPNNKSKDLLFKDILYWNPYIDESSKTTTVDVKCSLEKGNYAAIAESVDSNNNLQRSVFTFSVNEK